MAEGNVKVTSVLSSSCIFFLTLKLLSHKCNLPACHAVCFQLHFVWPYGILSGTDTCTIAKATECTSFIVQRMV